MAITQHTAKEPDDRDDAELRRRYALTQAAGLLERIEAAFQARSPVLTYRAEPRLQNAFTDSGEQFRRLIFSAARTLSTCRYEAYIAALASAHGGVRISTNGSELIAIPNSRAFTPESRGSWGSNREDATRFILFALNLYSEILSLPESETRFPTYKSTRAYRTWTTGGTDAAQRG